MKLYLQAGVNRFLDNLLTPRDQRLLAYGLFSAYLFICLGFALVAFLSTVLL